MALKHRLARAYCAWEGHVPVHGYTNSPSGTYECVCCDRCHKLLYTETGILNDMLRQVRASRKVGGSNG